MYDKRYSEAQIRRIRRGASISMFLCMAFLCYAVAHVAYEIGYRDGYNRDYLERYQDRTPAKQKPTT